MPVSGLIRISPGELVASCAVFFVHPIGASNAVHQPGRGTVILSFQCHVVDGDVYFAGLVRRDSRRNVNARMPKLNLVPLRPLRQTNVRAAVIWVGDYCVDKLIAR